MCEEKEGETGRPAPAQFLPDGKDQQNEPKFHERDGRLCITFTRSLYGIGV
jgi:hypothetical protein